MPYGSEVSTKIFACIVHNGGRSQRRSFVRGIHLVSGIEPSVLRIRGRSFCVERIHAEGMDWAWLPVHVSGAGRVFALVVDVCT